MNKLAFISLLTGLANGLAAETKFAPGDWPNWRGLTSDGQAPLFKGLPTEWSKTKNVVWKTPIPGKGHGTPTVVGGRIYLATADEEQMFQAVLCIDKDNGKVIWQTKVHKGQFPIGLNKNASHASTVVVHDGNQLYVNFVTGNQAFASALNLDGKVLWQKPIGKYKIHQGYGSSPMVHRDIVVVKADTKIGGSIVGLDKKTGREIWRRDRPKIANYTTPVVIEAAGRMQMVFCGCKLVTSLDPLTGKKLWET
ncbi:MAG TPA: PQQ-binding-like beta-propeller repeat protein, partial [Verrucomicrobiota bacterium]|nr:PQQ-binding-like beta-propeller repeat protein [Verrucomicrobiota bacterium]